MLRIIICLLAMMGALSLQAENKELKPRLVVCTDIAPADVEPDDMESMVRLMAYADQFEIEALITSVGWNCDPYPKEWAEYLGRVIEAYRKDVPRLMRRSGQTKFLPMAMENGQQRLGYWPSADYIKSRAVMGSERGGIKALSIWWPTSELSLNCNFSHFLCNFLCPNQIYRYFGFAEDTFARKCKEKRAFLWHFSRLTVSLWRETIELNEVLYSWTKLLQTPLIRLLPCVSVTEC